jgi:hypothetical protein
MAVITQNVVVRESRREQARNLLKSAADPIQFKEGDTLVKVARADMLRVAAAKDGEKLTIRFETVEDAGSAGNKSNTGWLIGAVAGLAVLYFFLRKND